MNTSDTVADRVARSNPSADDTPLPESTWDAATLLEVIDRRGDAGGETGLRLVGDPTPTDQGGRWSAQPRWSGPVVASAAAIVVLLIAVLTVLVAGRQEPIDPTDTTPTVTEPEPFIPDDVEVGSWQLPPRHTSPGQSVWVLAIDHDRVEINGYIATVENGELAIGANRTPASSWAAGIDSNGNRWSWERDDRGNTLHYRMTDPEGRSQAVNLPELPDRKRDVAARYSWLRIPPDGVVWALEETRRVGTRIPCLDAFRFEGSEWVLAVSCEQIPRPVAKADRSDILSLRAMPGQGNVLWVATNEAVDSWWVLHRIDGDTVETHQMSDTWGHLPDLWTFMPNGWSFSPSRSAFADPAAFHWGGMAVDADDRVWVLRLSPTGLYALASFHEETWTTHGEVVSFTIATDGTPWAVAEDPEEEHLPVAMREDPSGHPTLLSTVGVDPGRRPTVLWFDGEGWNPAWSGTGRCYTPHGTVLRPGCTISVAPDGTVWVGKATAVGKHVPKKKPDSVIRLEGINTADR